MERAVRDGLTRAIGLSNFDVEYMAEIMAGSEIPPAVNQVLGQLQTYLSIFGWWRVN